MKSKFSTLVRNLLAYVPNKVFRGGQETFYRKIRKAILDGHRTMYIEGPTGMGKSFIQSTISDAIIDGSDIQVLLLVPKITLLSQMQREFVKFAKHLTLGLFGDGRKDNTKQVTVMTYQSFLNVSNKKLLQYSALFLDEAHKALGPVTRAKIDAQTHAIIIGFTATSYYNETKSLKEWLGLEVHKVSISEAVRVGMISGIQFMIGKVKIKIAGRVQGETKKHYEERVGSDLIRQGANIAAARIYKQIFDSRSTRFIMFTLTVKQGHDLVRELRENGISAEIIHGGTKNRDSLFKRFARADFKVLVGIDVIKEGFDDPGVHGVLFAYPIGSIVGLVQGAGRATRIDELVPDKVAYVVQLMFDGRGQVWYQEVLEGQTLVLPPKERDKDLRAQLIGPEVLKGVSGHIIDSVAVETDEVMKLIRKHSKAFDIEEAPEGWMSSGQIGDLPDIQGGKEGVKLAAETHRKKHPKWFKHYHVSNNFAEHYHPDLVNILKEQCARKEKAPKGWMTVAQVAALSDVQGGDVKVKLVAKQYRKSHSKWFKQYMGGYHFTEHFHPDLVNILKEQCARKEKAPEGWMTPGKLSKHPDIQGKDSKLASIAEAYRKDHQEWFKPYRTGSVLVEHYHPDLIEILKKLCPRKEETPKGWMTAGHIMKIKGVRGASPKIIAEAETYRAKHKVWFKSFMTGPHFVEHYHPALVKILIKEFTSRKEAPEGWMTARKIRKIPGVIGGEVKVKLIAEQYRAKHKKWFNRYATGIHFIEHYHPDLVKILVERCSKDGRL